jgi:pyridoxamine 5'-phosphate oxidase
MNPNINVADLREDYRRASLTEQDVDQDPIAQFQSWLDEAIGAQLREPNAMTLATVDSSGKPSARIVLLKGLDTNGFCFYTNYESRKGKELAQQRSAALVFHWIELERQVRVEGVVSRMTTKESDDYFNSRPISSRIGAWASPQSEVIASRTIIEEREQHYKNTLGDRPDRPPHWGGFRLSPEMIEFWQGRSSRLHDRLRFTKAGHEWRVDRLAP